MHSSIYDYNLDAQCKKITNNILSTNYLNYFINILLTLNLMTGL